jgi:hypothetical protein
MRNSALIFLSIGFILVGFNFAAFSKGNSLRKDFSELIFAYQDYLLAKGYAKIDDRLHSFDIYEKGTHSVYFPVCIRINTKMSKIFSFSYRNNI